MSVNLEGLLQKRFASPAWATFFELRQATGFSRGEGRIDFAAFSMWTSKGDRTVACEIKRSRGDFMREIKNPEKRGWVEKQFRECYFVTPAGLVQPDEVPEGWGLLVATKGGSGLRQRKAAMQRNVKIGDALTRSILRRCAESEAKAEETAEGASRKGHGAGLCMPAEFVQRAMDAKADAHRAQLAAEYAARDVQAPLWRLAALATEYGAKEWSSGLVDELVERAAAKKIQGMLRQVVRAREELAALLDAADAPGPWEHVDV